MSKFIGFIVGAALVVAGAVTGNVALIIQGSAMIVASAAVLLTMPKVPARQASEMSIQLGEQPRSALFGEAFTAGSLVDGFNYGGKYGTEWECLIIRLADHKVDSLTGFYVNDEYVPYTGNGNYPQFDNNHFELYFRSDTTAQALPSVVTTHAPGWTSGDKGYSGADVVVCYRADKPDAKHPAWPGGRPRFGFVVKGKLCYDPRLDSTVDGGSGSHRWDTPSTWEWTDNPAVCRYNWARGIYANDEVEEPAQLLVGRGLSADEAPPENIFAAANLCDEDVDGDPRYRIAGPVYANQDHLEVEEMFAAATGGTVVTREGSVELEPGAAKSVVATFTDDDLISGSDVSWNHGVLSESSGEWVNTVVARYVEPDQKWNDHAAPVVRNTDDIIADGRPRETSITLRLVRHVNQALRVAEIVRRLGRIWGRATVTLGPRFCEIEDGDWVNWTSARRFNGETKTFRVEAYSINEKWQNTLTLREIDSSVYGSAAFDPDYSVATPSTPPPDVGEPDGGNWSLAAVLVSDAGVDVPALEITGDASDDDSVEAIIFEYWKDDGVINPVTDPDDPAWSVWGTLPPSTTKVDITGIEGGADYFVAITYVVSGIPGDRLVLGPVTAGSVDISDAVSTALPSSLQTLLGGDPNADRLIGWDDSASAFKYITPGTNLAITGTTLDATGGGGSVYGGWTELTFPGSTSSLLGCTVKVANETFSAAAGNKIEIEAELGKTSGSDLIVAAAVGSFGYYLACQSDDNNVIYRYQSGSPTAINASGSDSRFDYTGVHVIRFVVNLQSSTASNIHAVINDQRLPWATTSSTGWPVSDAPGAGMVGTVSIGLEGTIKRARARVIS